MDSSDVRSDVRFAWRLRRGHLMTLAVTTLSLGLGVGATTVMAAC